VRVMDPQDQALDDIASAIGTPGYARWGWVTLEQGRIFGPNAVWLFSGNVALLFENGSRNALARRDFRIADGRQSAPFPPLMRVWPVPEI
jgi:hypothetical protein